MAEVLVPALINAAVGYAISYVLAPDGPDVEGPRLDDRGVQKNAYGSSLGLVYGTMLTAGSLIYLENNELKETKHKEKSGGKGGGGGGSVTTYTYSFTGTIAFCEGPIVGVEKIWADTSLIYDASTYVDPEENPTLYLIRIAQGNSYDFDIELGSNTQGQWPDETAEYTASLTPAYRGTALHHVTDMELEKHGNRVPNFQYQVAGRFAYGSATETGDLSIRYVGAWPTLGFAGTYKDSAPNVVRHSAGVRATPTSLTVRHTDGGDNKANGYVSQQIQGAIRESLLTDPVSVTIPEDRESSKLTESASLSFYAFNNPEWQFLVFDSGGTNIQAYFLYNGQIMHSPVEPSGPYVSHVGSIMPVDSATSTHAGQWYAGSTGSEQFAASSTSLFIFENRDLGSVTTGRRLWINRYDVYGSPNPTTAVNLEARNWEVNDSNETVFLVGALVYVIGHNISTKSGITEVLVFDEALNLLAEYDVSRTTHGFTNQFVRINPDNTHMLCISETNGLQLINFKTDTVVYESGGLTDVPGLSGSWWTRVILGTTNAGYRWMSENLFTDLEYIWEFYYPQDSEGDGNATEGQAPLQDVVEDLCYRAGLTESEVDASGLAGTYINGYSIKNVQSLRESLEPLMLAYQFDPYEDDYKLKFAFRNTASVVTLTEDDLRAHPFGDKTGEIVIVEQIEETKLPIRVNVNYSNLSADYEPDTQFSERSVSAVGSKHIAEIDLPMSFTPEQAVQIADKTKREAWTGRFSYKFTLPFKYSYLYPSNVVTLSLTEYTVDVRLESIAMGVDGRLECTAVAHNTTSYTSAATTTDPVKTGSLVAQFPGDLVFTVIDTNLLRGGSTVTPGSYPVYCAGWAEPWEGYIVQVSYDGGDTWGTASSFQEVRPVMGYVTQELGTPPGEWLGRVDERDELAVTFFESNPDIESVTDLQMFAGSNIFAVGAPGRWELIGAATVTQDTATKFTLSRLLRGFRGTEGNIGSMQYGDLVIALDSSWVGQMQLEADDAGGTAIFRGIAGGDIPDPEDWITVDISGNPLREYAPSNVTAFYNASGDIEISWNRRTRLTGEWRDYVDAYIASDSKPENYTVEIYDDNSSPQLLRTISSISTTETTYTAAQRASDSGSPLPTSLRIKVWQVDEVIGQGYVKEVTI